MEISRLFDMLERVQKRQFQDVIFAGKLNNEWISYSSDDYIKHSYNLAFGLINIGIKPGDKVITITNNRPEWNFLDMGIMLAGAIHVPVYPTISDSDYKYIIEHSEAKLIFCAGKELLERVSRLTENNKDVLGIYTFLNISDKHLFQLIELGEKNKKPEIIETIKSKIKSNDLATIIYTSGTTGNPKGVMLSHNNIISNLESTYEIPPHIPNYKALSFLPLCHVYERMLNYMYQYNGFSIYYVDNIATIAENIKEVKPNIMSTVPRLLESIFDKIMLKGRKLNFPIRPIFFWAVNLGLEFEIQNRGWWYNLQLFFARKLVFKKWKEALGGDLDIIVSGGAALQERLARVFWAAGFRVLEGYGLTETSPVIAVNNFEANGIKFGTVGPPISNSTVKIAEDGEILCKGPGVMLGYYKEPKLTEEAFIDGWFKTGDIGRFELQGQLKITDRKKEIFKTSAGKYIAPQVIENKFKESPFIEQIIVVGENQKYPAALIVPNFFHLKSYCNVKNIPYSTDKEMSENTLIIKRIGKEVDKFNKFFGEAERIVRYELLSEAWTIAGGEFTPTLKLRRSFIQNKYNEKIELLFDIKKKQESINK